MRQGMGVYAAFRPHLHLRPLVFLNLLKYTPGFDPCQEIFPEILAKPWADFVRCFGSGEPAEQPVGVRIDSQHYQETIPHSKLP